MRKLSILAFTLLFYVVPGSGVYASAAPRVTAADVEAFNETLAAQSHVCVAMLNYASAIQAGEKQARVYFGPGAHVPSVEYAQAANVAKECGINVRAENDGAANRVPATMLARTCSWLKAHLGEHVRIVAGDTPAKSTMDAINAQQKAADRMLTAQTSWACGWPSPIPGFRPVPGFPEAE